MNLTHPYSNTQNNIDMPQNTFIPKKTIDSELDGDIITVLENELNCAKKQILLLTTELEETKNKLKKYTAPERNKLYYQKNKDRFQTLEEKEKRKEINRKAYEKRKQKQPQQQESVLYEENQ
jgi:hypothetical protein